MPKQSPKPKRGNPNFTKGNRQGVLLAPPCIEGEPTFAIATRLPLSLKQKFDALPGSNSQKLRHAVELLIQQSLDTVETTEARI
ncbi:MAG: hypothetical protein WCA35_04305 [Kovacikia sp.]|jgi:hypothetical protein